MGENCSTGKRLARSELTASTLRRAAPAGISGAPSKRCVKARRSSAADELRPRDMPAAAAPLKEGAPVTAVGHLTFSRERSGKTSWRKPRQRKGISCSATAAYNISGGTKRLSWLRMAKRRRGLLAMMTLPAHAVACMWAAICLSEKLHPSPAFFPIQQEINI